MTGSVLLIIGILVGAMTTGLFSLASQWLQGKLEDRGRAHDLRVWRLERASEKYSHHYDSLLNATNRLHSHLSSFGTIDGIVDDQSDAFLVTLRKLVGGASDEFDKLADRNANADLGRVVHEIVERCQEVRQHLQAWGRARVETEGIRVTVRRGTDLEILKAYDADSAIRMLRRDAPFTEMYVEQVALISPPSRESQRAYNALLTELGALRAELKDFTAT